VGYEYWGFYFVMTYAQKLKDPRWQKKRLEVLSRDNFTCTLCNNSTFELQVHHLKYSGEPWEASMENLETLCCHCHKMKTNYSATKALRSGDHLIYKASEGVFIYSITDSEILLGFPYSSKAPQIILHFLQNG
jgi:5-methylcytosine-specific restriction endonuclease McrA